MLRHADYIAAKNGALNVSLAGVMLVARMISAAEQRAEHQLDGILMTAFVKEELFLFEPIFRAVFSYVSA